MAGANEASPAARAWFHQARPAWQGDHANERVRELPFTGQVLHQLKAVNQPGGTAGGADVVTAAFDGNGQELADNGQGLLAAEDEAQWRARGGIQPALWQHLAEVAQTERIPVAIWLRSDEPDSPPREEFTNVYAGIADQALRAAAHAQAAAAFVAEATNVTDAPMRVQPGAPVIMADLTAAEIHALGWSSRVGWMDWERPYRPQLSSWYASDVPDTYRLGSGFNLCVLESRAPQAPSCSYAGSGCCTSGTCCTVPATACPVSSVSGENWADQLDDGVHGYTDDSFDYTARNSFDGQHSRAVIGALSSTNSPGDGLVPSSKILLADFLHPGFVVAAAWCFAVNAKYGATYVWNNSNTCDTGACPGLMDYYGSHWPWPVIAIASGNIQPAGGPDSQTVNLSWNPLTVGGSTDQGTGTNRGDDVVDPNSLGLNASSYTDWEVPQVVAPSALQSSDGQTDFTTAGTSLSSAQVAGMALQVLTANTAMATWPEPIRALLICSADQDVDSKATQFSMTDTVDDRGGAGEANSSLAVLMAAPTNRHAVDTTATWRGYDYGYFFKTTALCDIANNNPPGCRTGDIPNYTYWNHYYYVTGDTNQSNAKMRIVLTWDAHATCSNLGTTSASCANDSTHYIDGDIDMVVYDETGTQVATSSTWDSNWEAVEFPVSTAHTYKVKIVMNAWHAASTYYGIAWNTAPYTSL